MRQRLISIVMLAVVVLGTTAMFAHEGIRFVGTISKRDQTTLTMKCLEGGIVSMKLTKQTLVYRDKKKVAAAELKSGLTVVVDALAESFVNSLGENVDDVEAVEINIVPALKPSAGK